MVLPLRAFILLVAATFMLAGCTMAPQQAAPPQVVVVTVSQTVTQTQAPTTVTTTITDTGSDAPSPSPTPDATPRVTFTADDTPRVLTVVSAPADLPWSDIQISGTCAGHFNEDQNQHGTTSGNVRGGDQISGCASGESLWFSYKPNGSLLYGHTFP